MPARPALSLLCLAIPLAARVASASSSTAPDPRACIAAHADGQVFRDAEQLLAAREQFSTCAAPECPAPVRKECSELGAEVLASTPTLVLAATDEQGRDLDDVRVTLDGRSLTSRLDGSPILVDPGEHQLRFALRDGAVRELTVVARRAEKGRRVVARFEREAGFSESSEPGGGVPASVLVLGGVGAVALGSFAYFFVSARSLEDCAPGCTRADVDGIRSRYLWADVSLATSAVAFGAGAVIWLGASRSTSGTSPRTRVGVALAPALTIASYGLSARGHF